MATRCYSSQNIPKDYNAEGEPEATGSNSFNISFSATVKLSRVEFQVVSGSKIPTNMTVVLRDVIGGFTTEPITVISRNLEVPNSLELVRDLQIIVLESDVSHFTLVPDFFGCVKPGKY